MSTCSTIWKILNPTPCPLFIYGTCQYSYWLYVLVRPPLPHPMSDSTDSTNKSDSKIILLFQCFNSNELNKLFIKRCVHSIKWPLIWNISLKNMYYFQEDFSSIALTYFWTLSTFVSSSFPIHRTFFFLREWQIENHAFT